MICPKALSGECNEECNHRNKHKHTYYCIHKECRYGEDCRSFPHNYEEIKRLEAKIKSIPYIPGQEYECTYKGTCSHWQPKKPVGSTVMVSDGVQEDTVLAIDNTGKLLGKVTNISVEPTCPECGHPVRIHHRFGCQARYPVCACKRTPSDLKLLEWLKERCTEHPQYDEEVGGSKYKVYCSHQRCLVCMAELESKLKEG